MEHDPGDAADQLRGLSENINGSWRFVIYCLQKATYELIDVDAETAVALELNFWHEHIRLLEAEEALQPGISVRIFERFEAIAAELRQAEDDFFEQGLRRRKRSALVKGLFGLHTEPVTYEQVMASRKQGAEIANL